MAKRLVPVGSRPLAALALLGALCACATTSAEPRPTTQPAGWRIVERTGEARHLPPTAAAWLSATIGEALADGSEVSTGRGSRLIVDAPGRNISVGPNSRFVLPGGDRRRSAGPASRIIALSGRGGGTAAADPHPVARAGAAGGRGRCARQPSRDRGHRQGRSGARSHAGWPAPDPDDRRPVGASRWRGRGAARGPAGARRCVAAGRAADRSRDPAQGSRSGRTHPAEPTGRAAARSPTGGPPALSPADAPTAPPAGRVQGAPTALHQAPSEARPQLAADMVEAPPAGRRATEAGGARQDDSRRARRRPCHPRRTGLAHSIRKGSGRRSAPSRVRRRRSGAPSSTGSPPACSTRSRQLPRPQSNGGRIQVNALRPFAVSFGCPAPPAAGSPCVRT